LQFCNLFLNDIIYLLDEILHNLQEIKKAQLRLAEEGLGALQRQE